MKWWKRWRERHWDEIEHPEFDAPGHWGPAWREAPPFRAWVRRLGEECMEKPLQAVGIAGSLIAAILGLIAWIIRSLV